MDLVEATDDDVETLTEFWFSLASEMERYSRFNELVYDDASEVPSEGFGRLLDDDAVTVYLVEVDGSPVGYVTLRRGSHPSREYGEYTDIVDLFVEADARNRGYGSAVVEHVKELARQEGCDHLKVSCEWANDDARRFYRDTGFEEKQVAFVQALD